MADPESADGGNLFMSTVSPSPGERRAAAREKARRLRHTQQRRDRRRRWIVTGSIAAGVVAALVVVAVVLATSVKPPQPGPSNMLSDGILIGEDRKAVRTTALRHGASPVPHPLDTTGQTVRVVEYVDFHSTAAAQFTAANADQLGKLLDQGAATVEIHPVALLTNQSGASKYSLRAANAAACVADYAPDSFWDFDVALFAKQPAEGEGLTDAQLISAARSAGAAASGIRDCVGEQRFASWVQDASDRAAKGPLPDSDTKNLAESPFLVLVNGQTYAGPLTSPEDFRAFIVQAQGQTYDTPSSSSPAPAPSTTVGTAPSGGKAGKPKK